MFSFANNIVSFATKKLFYGAGARAEDDASYIHALSADGGVDMDGMLHADDVVHDKDDADGMDISSHQPMLYVGVIFDTFDDIHKFYNHKAFKIGFGTQIQLQKTTNGKGLQHLTKGFSSVSTREELSTMVRLIALQRLL